jgi:hypothetical protein
VAKIKAKYDHFMESEYNVEDAASRVETRCDKLEGLDIAINYNYALWLTHYTEHLSFMEGLHNVGDITDMSTRQVLKHIPEVDVLHQASMELGDLTQEDYNEKAVFTRIVTQFSWGSRFAPPFIHSSDALNAVAATLGKLGK